MWIRTLLLAVALLQATHPPAPPAAPAAGLLRNGPALARTSGPLFDNVIAVLGERYFDEEFRTTALPALTARYRLRAERASTIAAQRQVVHDLLSEVPASHLGLLSRKAFDAVIGDLRGDPYPTPGFQLIGFDGGFYAGFVLEGGPAARAGLLPGDVVRSIDGVPTAQSPRLEWRSDDAFIKDDRDPPVHLVHASRGERLALTVERQPGELLKFEVPVEDYSALQAARASVRTIAAGDVTVGLVHFWFVHLSGVPQLLQESFDGPLRQAQALIVDLRGRGGSYLEIAKILEVLRGDLARNRRPIVALVDRQSRSGKDILAYELKQNRLARLVGEPSAGAVIPATFADVGHDTILMFPAGRLPRYTEVLEFKPVQPDVPVERAGPFAAGRDSILDAGIQEAVRLLQTGRY
jgi:carboxyl-terminal processing protease